MSNQVNDFSLIEEIWHAMTHGIGFALSIAALVLLIVFAVSHGHGVLHVTAAAIYGSTLIVMYGSSTLYHAITHERAKGFLQIMDHASIYVLIAGSYTPIALICIGGTMGWVLFGLEWGIALIGIAIKFIFPGRFELLSLTAYLVMGWLIVLDFGTFKSNIDPIAFWLIVAGGLAYSGGIVFYIKDNITHFHTIWHLFVMMGSIFHFMAILLYVV
ncbi:PAQR family membrane homeostasis protein TrhA [Sulfurovum riftiae]|uniref:Hemolysin III n=1 Tax=Sulfurovum riftiae TaxID=1630136 RepID=A0A151CES1_9BACT|nr:hemolysin III family protein [Sulfurovum riftiae]KYJ86016.1 hemolysin III [Sulfurovum riftiae]